MRGKGLRGFGEKLFFAKRGESKRKKIVSVAVKLGWEKRSGVVTESKAGAFRGVAPQA